MPPTGPALAYRPQKTAIIRIVDALGRSTPLSRQLTSRNQMKRLSSVNPVSHRIAPDPKKSNAFSTPAYDITFNAQADNFVRRRKLDDFRDCPGGALAA